MRVFPWLLIVCVLSFSGINLARRVTRLAQPEPVTSTQQVTPARTMQDSGTRFAEALEDLLAATKETQYQHTTDIDEANGIVKCDCSGLLVYMLREHFPQAHLALHGKEAAWRKRPLAVTFYETFQAAPEESGRKPWIQVKRLVEVLPGDIIAWRKKDIARGKSTGHVLMVASYPEMLRNGQVRIRTIESTSVLTTKGFQASVKTFTTDRAGYPTGFLVNEKQRKADIAVGRLNDLGAVY